MNGLFQGLLEVHFGECGLEQIVCFLCVKEFPFGLRSEKGIWNESDDEIVFVWFYLLFELNVECGLLQSVGNESVLAHFRRLMIVVDRLVMTGSSFTM